MTPLDKAVEAAQAAGLEIPEGKCAEECDNGIHRSIFGHEIGSCVRCGGTGRGSIQNPVALAFVATRWLSSKGEFAYSSRGLDPKLPPFFVKYTERDPFGTIRSKPTHVVPHDNTDEGIALAALRVVALVWAKTARPK